MTKVSGSPPKRPRTREPRSDSARANPSVVPWEHARVFAQLFDGSGDGAGSGASLTASKASAHIAMIQALTEQLVPRILGASQWPLVAVLYVPRLGRINTRVRREQGEWSVELAAEEESTAQWLGGVRQRFQDGLTQSLGAPVSVSLANTGLA
ncbi:flagellar hook-length control protein FliK [Pseudomonas tolaasii]|uniref:Flagellar hook-length control protein FliK n=2 Tax=Pseudomonas tolaasii TaxID=29442 RepID=A0A7Y8AQ55_PSETO|nr:type III secretion system HrpP C-terminal domain-containing protein [Pseudomonas tolaasii]ARB25810.1 flagellar hook-length control protein FliK [Pseudomonas tolaasii]KAB0475895.1 flagellar hook-length control protein FliK [Pseudomonas tolaasii]MBY8940827.1 flagellar hook-length control protein FliK [Pseudomonas tolaasii]NWC21867.1 flagellar hook-length control protein FliK [Pseudomonas tolaasii]NWC40425.1 flagellar hook-length control protein FliK [Pseudomonas tolaasii]